MTHSARIELALNPDQHRQLLELQVAFTSACNSIAPTVVSHRCWNRVTLHHLTYRQLRDDFPRLGSQMACNAIYAVCRAARIVYQHPKSPFNVAALGTKPLPRMQFTVHSPVYFDRHTLSLREGQVSLFTLDGRIKLGVTIDPDLSRRFREERLREVVLNSKSGRFGLGFVFGGIEPVSRATSSSRRNPEDSLPEYVQIHSLPELRKPGSGTNFTPVSHT